MLPDLEIQRTEQSRLPEVDFDSLGFGDVFCDHMFIMNYADGRWQKPLICPFGAVPVEPGAGGLHYGQAAFEGLKAFRGTDAIIRVFRPDMNLRRLHDSCARLCIPCISDAVFYEVITQLIQLDHEWIPHKRGEAFYIRPIIFSTESHLEVRPATNYCFAVITSPVRQYFDSTLPAVRLKVEEQYTRAAPGGLGFAKTGGNYAASLLPSVTSRDEGFDQVLWLDGAQHKFVEEVGQMNIFFIIDDRVITPSLVGTILPGVTRDTVITLLREKGFACEERRITIDEVIEAARNGHLKEAFGSGTAAVISPVGTMKYKGEVLNINNGMAGDVTKALYDEITGIQYGEIEDHHGWNLVVDITQSASQPMPAIGEGR